MLKNPKGIVVEVEEKSACEASRHFGNSYGMLPVCQDCQQRDACGSEQINRDLKSEKEQERMILKRMEANA